jgi:sec-independent protein translocase protein TatB
VRCGGPAVLEQACTALERLVSAHPGPSQLHPGAADAITLTWSEPPMFGMSGTELAIVLVLALLLLGPDKLPSLARTVGKAVRDFKRATNDIKGTVESEFYKMDQPETPLPAESLPATAKVEGTVASSSDKPLEAAPAAASTTADGQNPYEPKAGEPPKS